MNPVALDLWNRLLPGRSRGIDIHVQYLHSFFELQISLSDLVI